MSTKQELHTNRTAELKQELLMTNVVICFHHCNLHLAPVYINFNTLIPFHPVAKIGR